MKVTRRSVLRRETHPTQLLAVHRVHHQHLERCVQGCRPQLGGNISSNLMALFVLLVLLLSLLLLLFLLFQVEVEALDILIPLLSGVFLQRSLWVSRKTDAGSGNVTDNTLWLLLKRRQQRWRKKWFCLLGTWEKPTNRAGYIRGLQYGRKVPLFFGESDDTPVLLPLLYGWRMPGGNKSIVIVFAVDCELLRQLQPHKRALMYSSMIYPFHPSNYIVSVCVKVYIQN